MSIFALVEAVFGMRIRNHAVGEKVLPCDKLAVRAIRRLTLDWGGAAVLVILDRSSD